MMRAESIRKRLLPGEDSGNEKPWRVCLLQSSQLPFPFIKGGLSPLLSGDLHVAHHVCRPWIAILCWSQINSSLLKKYMAVNLFQVNIIYPHNITFHRLRVQCYKTVPYFLPLLLQWQSQAQVVASAYYWLAYKSETSKTSSLNLITML